MSAREELDLAALAQWSEKRDLPDVDEIVRLFPRLADDLAATLRELAVCRDEIAEMSR